MSIEELCNCRAANNELRRRWQKSVDEVERLREENRTLMQILAEVTEKTAAKTYAAKVRMAYQEVYGGDESAAELRERLGWPSLEEDQRRLNLEGNIG